MSLKSCNFRDRLHWILGIINKKEHLTPEGLKIIKKTHKNFKNECT